MKNITLKKAINTLLTASFAVLISFTFTASANAQLKRVKPKLIDGPILTLPVTPVDIGLRKALYHTGTDAADLSPQDPYGTPNKTLVLSRSQVASCAWGNCQVNLGFFLTRDKGESQALNTYASISGGMNPTGSSVIFPQGSKTTELVLPVLLRNGQTRLTIQLKKYLNGQEANSANNRFTVDVILNP